MVADWITEAGDCDWVTDAGECGVEEGGDVGDVAGLAAAELRSMRWCKMMAVSGVRRQPARARAAPTTTSTFLTLALLSDLGCDGYERTSAGA